MYTIIIRTVILFFIIMITMRFLGKRQLGELQIFDLVITLMISELAALPISDPKIPMIYGIIPIITLILLQVIISLIELKSEKARILLSGHPSILVRNGKVDIEELKKQKFTLDDLLEDLRIGGYFNLEDVEYAILETSGELSVLPKTDLQPATKKDMKIKSKQDCLPLTIVVDGKVRTHNLKLINKDMNWLQHEMNKNKINEIKDVFIALFDSQGKLYFQSRSEANKNSKANQTKKGN